MTQANKDIYVGQWLRDKATGHGVFYDAVQGVRYSGEWLMDA